DSAEPDSRRREREPLPRALSGKASPDGATGWRSTPAAAGQGLSRLAVQRRPGLLGRGYDPDRVSVVAEVVYHLRSHRCVFPAPGLYQFTLMVDGDWVAQRRLRVYKREIQT